MIKNDASNESEDINTPYGYQCPLILQQHPSVSIEKNLKHSSETLTIMGCNNCDALFWGKNVSFMQKFKSKVLSSYPCKDCNQKAEVEVTLFAYFVENVSNKICISRSTIFSTDSCTT